MIHCSVHWMVPGEEARGAYGVAGTEIGHPRDRTAEGAETTWRRGVR